MKILLPLLLLVEFTFAGDVVCNLMDNPNASELKISYVNDAPSSVFLKSPGSETYREMDMNIDVISLNEHSHAFNAAPIEPENIDWNNEPFCYKEIGTQWYFNLFYDRDTYYVYFMPYYVKDSASCIPPRKTPQEHPLDCQVVEQE